jgi:hypothetical protein
MKNIILVIATTMMVTLPLAAQDLIVPKSGSPITVYNVDASKMFIYYTVDDDANAPMKRIARDSVLMVRRADGTAMDLESPFVPTKPTTNYPVIEEADIHGNLIAKGNRVYIPTDSKNGCERSGQEFLKQKMQEWGYWTVADKLEQAHFVLQYTIDSKGADYSFLLIRPRKYYKTMPSVDFKQSDNIGFGVARCRTNDADTAINHANASLMFNHIKKLMTDPDYDKKVKKYTGILYDNYYDYNSSEYFYHYISNMTAEGKNNVTHSKNTIPILK